jgi:hypothetical protein
MKPLKKGPSPALIVAVAAMAFALVGTAVAANDGSIYPKLSKSKVKKIAKKQATKQLKANVNNSHVNLADEATTAATADEATTAETAASPSLWAHVNTAGTVLDGNGIATSNVTKSGNYYCFSGLPVDPKGGTATSDYWNGTPTFDTMLQLGIAASGGLGGTGCPPDTQAFVLGVRARDDVPSTVAFYISFYG